MPKVCESFNDPFIFSYASLLEPCQSTRLHAALCEQIYSCPSMWSPHSMSGKVQNPTRRISVHICLCVEQAEPGTVGAQTHRLLRASTVPGLLPPRYEGGTILWKLQYETGGGGQFLALTVLQNLQNFTQITIMEVLSNTFSVALSNQRSFSVSSVKWK